MKKRRYKHSTIKRTPELATANVIYASLRTTRLRSERGELFSFPTKYFPGLLPGDRVTGEVGKMRGERNLKPKTLYVEWQKTVQVVLRCQGNAASRKLTPTLEVVGLSLPGDLEMSDLWSELQDGQLVVATIRRKRTRTRQRTRWEVVSFDRQLTSQREVAAAVARARFGIEDDWPSAVSEELKVIDNGDLGMQLNGRRDLRHLPFVTIDPASAKDHDDAAYCQSIGSGEFRLFVAIADVAHYVTPGSLIDTIALGRGASIYFPGESVPMLPPELSAHTCSLIPQVDRLAMVCEMTVNTAGKVTDYDFYEAVICSQARLTYEEVQSTGGNDQLSSTVADNLRCMDELRDVFLAARQVRGVLNLDIAEVEYAFDPAGNVQSVTKAPKLISYSLIEEAMLAANICAAQFIAKHYTNAGLYRIHDTPVELKLSVFNQILKYMGVKYAFTSTSSLGEYQRVLENIKIRHPKLFSVLQLHLLRSFEMAVYSSMKSPHFALNFPEYTHFTSPIRRYPDLVVHRMIKSALNGTTYSLTGEELSTVAGTCSFSERQAESCAREAERWLKSAYMKSHVGETFSGVVVDSRKFGMFVQLDSPYVDGMVPVEKLGGERFYYDSTVRTLTGRRTGKRFGIGDRIKIRVASADPELGHIDFELA